MRELHVRNWPKWQSYRSDRGQPPWIKVHRQLLRDPNFVRLSDTQRGHLMVMWILAADREGQLPSDPAMIRKLCYMDEEPDVEVFVSLGFLEWRQGDATVTPARRQADTLARSREAEAEEEAETETEAHTHRAREAERETYVENSDPLAEWLGEYRSGLERFELWRDAELRTTVHRAFGPPGMRANAWKRPDGTSVPPEDRPRLFALAAEGYAAEGAEKFVTNQFAGMLRTTIRSEEPPTHSKPPPDSEAAQFDAEAERWRDTKRRMQARTSEDIRRLNVTLDQQAG